MRARHRRGSDFWKSALLNLNIMQTVKMGQSIDIEALQKAMDPFDLEGFKQRIEHQQDVEDLVCHH
jgi:hypothetical protein